jgi:hypothetical protein
LNASILDASPESTIDARGARVRDPLLPTFLAEHVLGDPTPNASDLAFGPSGLTVTQLTATRLRVDWTIVNQGPREVAPGAVAAFFWSEDDALDASDVELARITIGVALPGRGGEAEGSLDVTVPSAALGFVVGSVDPDDAVAELNEHNNEHAARRPVADLSFRGTRLAVTMTSATDAVVNWTVFNSGNLAAPAGVAIAFHLSSDETLDDDDPLLLTRTLADPLPARTDVGGSDVLHDLPPDLAFFVIATVDADEVVEELSETNNRQVGGVGPNLTIQHLVVGYSVSAQRFTITVRVANEGERPAVGRIETRFTMFSAGGQTMLGTVAFDDLAAGATREEAAEVPFENLPDSLHIVFATTDAGNAVVETDEFDNTSAANVVRVP